MPAILSHDGIAFHIPAKEMGVPNVGASGFRLFYASHAYASTCCDALKSVLLYRAI